MKPSVHKKKRPSGPCYHQLVEIPDARPSYQPRLFPILPERPLAEISYFKRSPKERMMGSWRQWLAQLEERGTLTAEIVNRALADLEADVSATLVIIRHIRPHLTSTRRAEAA